ASVLIGVTLGLTGGGGSILTVPVLVYLFGINPLIATSYSLFIVGSTSLIATLSNIRQQVINYRDTLFFGLTSLITVFLTRKFVIPIIPNKIASIGSFSITDNLLTLTLFAILMIAAAWNMIWSNKDLEPEKEQSVKKINQLKIL